MFETWLRLKECFTLDVFKRLFVQKNVSIGRGRQNNNFITIDVAKKKMI